MCAVRRNVQSAGALSISREVADWTRACALLLRLPALICTVSAGECKARQQLDELSRVLAYDRNVF